MRQWYLLVQAFDYNLYLNTRITFGGVTGCRSFDRPADAWTKIMQHEHDIVEVFRWVDDNLFLKRYELKAETSDIVLRSKALGKVWLAALPSATSQESDSVARRKNH